MEYGKCNLTDEHFWEGYRWISRNTPAFRNSTSYPLPEDAGVTDGIIHQKSEAVNAFKFLCSVMKERLEEKTGYPEKIFPRIICVIDELPDFPMDGNEVAGSIRESIIALAADGHRTGIHLILISRDQSAESCRSN